LPLTQLYIQDNVVALTIPLTTTDATSTPIFMLNRLKAHFVIIVFLLTVSLCLTNRCFAQSVRLSLINKGTDNHDKIALVVDHAEKIAGVKVILTYDKNMISFIKAEKSTATSSFLHVVNDKTPGKLIIVMASAKGISGDNLVLISFEFTGIKRLAETKSAKIAVTQIQLMNEDLQEIAGNRPQYLFKPDL